MTYRRLHSYKIHILQAGRRAIYIHSILNPELHLTLGTFVLRILALVVGITPHIGFIYIFT